MGDIEIRYTTRDIADMLGVEAVTIRKYALALEKAGYSIDRSDGKNRSYSERDAMAFKYLQSIRSRTSITVEEAANLIVQRNSIDTESGDNITHSNVVALPEQYDERYDQLEAKLNLILANQQASATTIQALPDPKQQRSERLNERITERRVESKLRDEAEALWNEKPKAERMKRVGLFRKEEDSLARERFIRKYIDERFESRMREEYGLE